MSNLRLGGDTSIDYSICLGDVCDEALSTAHISRFLKGLKKQRVDFVLSHPPYWDIVKFTDNEADLSQSKTLDRFLSLFLNSTENTVKYLRSGKHFAIVVGDLYRDGEIVPLAFYMMDVIKKNIKCKLKGIVVKDIVGNRRKMGTEDLWRYRTLKSDTFLFKHEYIFLFKKG